jgi:hypothetical protein
VFSSSLYTHTHTQQTSLPQIAKLGPDPLREDADVEELWAKVQRCKKPVGLVLMDQSMMAGALWMRKEGGGLPLGRFSRGSFASGTRAGALHANAALILQPTPPTQQPTASKPNKGVGNIYRAEILYKAGIHPEQPAHTLSRAAFDDVWRHSVELLQRGFVSGSILTVRQQRVLLPPPPVPCSVLCLSCRLSMVFVRLWA